jgi:selenocysteine lyase/cysteine desulfurase
MVSEIARRAERLGIGTVPEKFRAPHFTGLTLPSTFPRDLPQRLAAKKIFVSVRGESLRISPYLYNEMWEVERLFEAIEAEI